ncbi:ABC transporter substrate-binding protein [Metabacillus litoralis]|uniref:ABC transporter substrate-binding protein n=1 Tax=Metabacillus TaxID=2675233 RepID=UPI000EF5E35E|nr:ABC transporter substrate-binding protein [Metabacillus litoralis]MCM3161436.1 ABC transporter substrate-binding protein [Metabacillus litoralis]
MKKRFGNFALFLFLIFGLVGCNQSEGTSGESDSNSEGASNDGGEPLEISVIIKATDSGFWQTVLQGAKAAEEELGNKVKITTDGPPSEADIDEQVAILENTVTRQPDGIVIASTSSDATVPAIENAMSQDIPVVLVDNKVNTENFTSFLATDNLVGGALAADKLVEQLKAQGKELKGKVGVISSMAGVKVLEDRDQGFIDRMAEIAPDIELLKTRYVDNDISKALSAAQDIITSNPDVLGFFADNNHTGIGVGRAVTEQGLAEDIPVVAYDADEEQINSLKAGAIDVLIVQDPFGMGYQGVLNVIDSIEGKEVEKTVDTGVTAVSMENFEEEDIQKLLYPEKR